MNISLKNINHWLSINTQHFNEALCGLKDFEIVLNVGKKFKVGDICRLIEIMGKKHFDTCLNIANCLLQKDGIIDCNMKREVCYGYDEKIVSGRKMTIEITAVFELCDITNDNRFDDYVAFKFKILDKENC